MCAIAGLICLTRQDCDDGHVAIVRQMCDVQTHRGPDDQGVVTQGWVCLGSDRLQIIDLTKAGHMPMSDANADRWIVYNGELYNFRELRQELSLRGHQFRSHSDTEVVLHAFMQWGAESLERFVGMFAFALYDRPRDTVTLVRDRFGKKPLYYTYRDGVLLFASELKALMQVCDHLQVNQRRLAEWSLYRNIDFGSPETLIEGCWMLPAGHYLQICEGKVDTPRCYYTPEAEARYADFQRKSKQEVVDEIASLLTAAVHDRLVSDVPIGTLCSGGLDSSLVTALCTQQRQDVTAFNVAIAGHKKLDENQYAQQVADMLGIRLFTYTMTGADFRRTLPRAIYHNDLPLTFANSVCYLLISELARSQGTIMLLSGEAADELFGGYMNRYRRYRQFMWAQRLMPYLPNKIRLTLTLAGHACLGIPATEFEGYGTLLPFATAWSDQFTRTELRLRCQEAYQFVRRPAERAVLSAMAGDLTNFLAPLLRRLDRMSMATSVACRVPFLDHRLVEAALNLPLAYRLRGSHDKWILKAIAARHLPRHIAYRKKQWFPLPLAEYLAPLAHASLFQNGFCLEYIGLERRVLDELVTNWQRDLQGFFNLVMLELWGRLFILHQSIDDLTNHVITVSADPGDAAAPVIA